MTDERLLTAEQIARSLTIGVGATAISPSGHGWKFMSAKAGGPARAEPGGAGWIRLRFEAAIGAPISQMVMLDLAGRTSDANIALTSLIDA